MQVAELHCKLDRVPVLKMVQFAQCHFFHLRRVWSDAAQSPGPSAIVERRLILQRMRTVHQVVVGRIKPGLCIDLGDCRSEEHTSELQSLMRISYAVFCLTKKITTSI